MTVRTSLRFRVTLSFALLAAGISATLAGVLYVLTIRMEEQLVEDTLSAELEDYMSRYVLDPGTAPPSSTTIRSYVLPPAGERNFPGVLDGLHPGLHRVELDGTGYYAEVRVSDGVRFAVLYDDTRIRRRETRFMLVLAGAAITMTLLSAVLGWWLARRVVYPVSELARRVTALSPAAGRIRLGDRFPDDEVGQLAHDFDDYQQRLAEFVERERAFTGDVSHELRTPLAVIEGASEILLTDSDLDGETRGRVERIARSASEASEVVSALLLLAREENTEAYSVSECQVEDVLKQVVQGYMRPGNKKPVFFELKIHEHPVLEVEPALLRVVLSNLIRNAYAYTHEGGIKITLASDGVTIEDTGVGMSKSELGRVFERHYRATDKGGAGIGLSLVKRICQRYGWHINIMSEEGIGTRVQLLFK